MKILLLSDTHGELLRSKALIDKEQADIVLHMGDVGFDPHYLGQVYYVKGNHDSELQEPKERLLTFQNHTIYMTHGDLYEWEVMEHLQQKKATYWLDMDQCIDEFVNVLYDVGSRKHADIICFGHTHQALVLQRNGVWIVNPGSLAYPMDGKLVSYALMNIEQHHVKIQLKYHPFDEK